MFTLVRLFAQTHSYRASFPDSLFLDCFTNSHHVLLHSVNNSSVYVFKYAYNI